jgi:hypothetical protein
VVCRLGTVRADQHTSYGAVVGLFRRRRSNAHACSTS